MFVVVVVIVAVVFSLCRIFNVLLIIHYFQTNNLSAMFFTFCLHSWNQTTSVSYHKCSRLSFQHFPRQNNTCGSIVITIQTRIFFKIKTTAFCFAWLTFIRTVLLPDDERIRWDVVVADAAKKVDAIVTIYLFRTETIDGLDANRKERGGVKEVVFVFGWLLFVILSLLPLLWPQSSSCQNCLG